MKTPIVPAALRDVYDNWHFAPAVRARGLVFCSGIIGTSPDGNKPQSGLAGAQATLETAPQAPLETLVAVRDPKAQFETAFEALAEVLAEAGATLADIVEMTTYHVDMATHFDTFVDVRNAYLAAPWPAWTAIGVNALAIPGGLVELRAVALDPAG